MVLQLLLAGVYCGWIIFAGESLSKAFLLEGPDARALVAAPGPLAR
jgi:hypothetical protein